MKNKGIAKFEKISFKQFKKDVCNDRETYESIKLPERSTNGSAGYDFYSPYNYCIRTGESAKIPTGIRCKIKDGWVLTLHVRSSIGFKYHTILSNITGIIDSDYYGSDNEGHIFIKLVNHGDKTLSISKGDRIVQGVFLPYGITKDDNVLKTRNGGFGSTGE